MRGKLLCGLITVLLLAAMVPSAFARSPLFDGMFVVWTGSGEWDYNGLKSTIKISARLQVQKTTDGYATSISASISGVPRTAPFLTTATVLTTAGTDRTMTYNNTQIYSPFWIEQGKSVGDKVQMGTVASPYTLELQTYEAREIMGKSVRCLVSTYSIKTGNLACTMTISGKAYFDAYSGIVVAGTMVWYFISLQSPYYEKVTGEISLSETNVEIGGPAWPWWLMPLIAIGVAVAVSVSLILYRRRRTKRVARPVPLPPTGKPTIPPPPPKPEIPGPSEPTAAPQPPGKKCWKCGATLREEWPFFCGECGTPVTKT